MNIHEHQAKEILKKYGAIVPEGVFSYSVEELLQKAKSLKTEKFVLKAQIHAGGRGKAGGIKIVNTIEELNSAAKEMLGKILITHQEQVILKIWRMYVMKYWNRFVRTLINPLLLPLVTDRKHFAKLSARKKRVSMLKAKRSTSR